MALDLQPADPSLADPLPDSPLPLLDRWIREAREDGAAKNPDAMALATVGADGEPSVRMVLGRSWDRASGELAFYTSYASAKAHDLEAHPVASVVFYWEATSRQARLSGPVARAPAAQSDAYWETRPRLSQVAARASRQSEPLASRDALLARMETEGAAHGGLEAGDPIPRPDDWGGYVIRPRRIELWVGADGRAHDRVSWERELSDGPWRRTRLQP